MENNKIKKEINDIVNDNLKALEQLFPSAVKDGQLDIKALKEELGDFEEVTTEKYELNWAGKQNAKKRVQQGIGNKTLKFVEKDSKNADTTENIYIEGDNLEVLKLLRQNYYNSIKMIYIDPPYNTGNDFVYNDTFKMDKEESDKAEGIISENNEKLQKNQKSTNRYHANWLNMMYPRLKLARDLLTDEGVIFISIDDNEQANLKRLCDEIFGEENFVGVISNITGASQNGEGVLLQKNIEYCLVYSKLIDRVSINKVDKANEELRNLSDAPTSLITRPDMGYTIYYNTETNDIIPVKDYNKNKILSNIQEEVYQDVKELIENGYIPIRPGIKNNQLHRWRWGFETFSERKNEIIVKKINDKFNVYFKQSGYNPPKNIQKFSVGTNELKKLFDNIKIFDYPKSVNMLKYLVSIGMNKGDLMIDFFSGSATTAHAVMKLNSEDNGNRKYIMVQLPETTDEKSEAFKAGYKNIAEIGKERIRRAGEKIKQEIEEYNSNLKLGEEPKKVPDIGFKVFKVDDTNIKWYDLENFNEESQYSFDDPDSLDFVLGSNDIDIVYEIMLRQNDVPLSENLEVLTDIGNRTYLYASTYLICLETEITEEMVEKLASLDPLPIKFVFRDSAFKDNISLKDETFRKLRSLIERNSGESKVSYRVEFI
ncbi:DNA (cytosine-5-)-methyltransferase [Leptotrichia sp. oral taxon 215 str. W9775]|uniref:site-specific DNA-methyltransferase n=1 Tax=Leptotrichia sp. oral taxon 215 TaxID=712359 RepID=UPI0003ADA399|nr:site-specific DNA-methyltransferase [Leptotrichia sp. oral taxon 215]ERK66722.1 DNA (cytosine-5-)-methyltransferase [Leptotrichia sp. oral taxon 215 str. W9775]